MANQGMGKSMGNRECEWVRARLPLWVGDGGDDGLTGDNTEGRDLTAEDRREMERHVAECSSCRRYQAALEQALGALAVAAVHMPVETKAPSLWPLLQSRIARHDARTPSRWRRATCGLADRWVRAIALLDGERPLRLAWMHDSLREALQGRKQQAPHSTRTPVMVLRYSVAATVLIALIGVPVLRRQWIDAQSTIVANAAPLADRVAPAQQIDETSPGVADSDDDGDVSSNNLAEADPVRSPETLGSGYDGALGPSRHLPSGSVTTLSMAFPCHPTRAIPSRFIEFKPWSRQWPLPPTAPVATCPPSGWRSVPR